MSYVMSFVWIALGTVEVTLFFVVSHDLIKRWGSCSPKLFAKNIFWIAFLLRIIWVIFSYYFYLINTGIPFEYGAADSFAYHADAKWLSENPWEETWNYLFASRSNYSDSGYCLYLSIVYRIVGPSVFMARVLKAVYGSIICVLIYKLGARTVDEKTGRMASVFAMLMPNLIIYCGLHLKETEMLFLMVLFLERSDVLLRSRKITFWNAVIPMLIAGYLFLFRTVAGVVAIFSLVTAVVFSPTKILQRRRRVVLMVWVALGVLALAGGVIMNEVEELWMNRSTNQEAKRMGQTIRGNQWAKYATGSVMAPMMFVLPFSTMVDTDQENQMILHGGNYVRNFMGIFVLISFYVVLIEKKNWRDFALIGSFAISYLGIIAMSGFANAERFLLPGLPCLIIFWAYGISNLNVKNYRFVKLWYLVVPVMEIAWAYFKIGSRGLL